MQIGLSLSLTAQLRSSSTYAVLGSDPALVFDFKNSYYRKVGASTTFASAITHTASTNATMVDSDGLLKWRPHNNLTKSNTFSTWNKSSVVVVDNAAVGPNGVANTASTVNFSTGSSHLYNLSTVSVKAGDKVTLAAWVRSDTITSITFATNGRGQTPNNVPEANLAVTSTWALVSFEATVAANDTGLFFIIGKVNASSPASQIGELELYGAHMFRSDLGGMVNNPDTASSYVPTTSAAVYAPRTGHHIYNGSAWVNEGLLHESEARTNLLLNSGTLSTQSATVSAVENTLSFTGTGTVTLSGASTVGPLVGTGTGENNRVSLTFTPAAGTLTLTVSGAVTNAQLEAGATPSSYIPTAGASATRAAETLTVPAANLPYDNTNMSIQIDGKMSYADGDNINEVQPYDWTLNGPNYIFARVSTSGTRSGQPTFLQRETTSGNDFVNGIPNAYTPDTNVPFNLASRHGSTFINGANEGTLLTANTTPTILPDLSSTDLELGNVFMGTIGQFRMWSDDLGDVGIAEAST